MFRATDSLLLRQKEPSRAQRKHACTLGSAEHIKLSHETEVADIGADTAENGPSTFRTWPSRPVHCTVRQWPDNFKKSTDFRGRIPNAKATICTAASSALPPAGRPERLATAQATFLRTLENLSNKKHKLRDQIVDLQTR